jgi:hypothetical protein
MPCSSIPGCPKSESLPPRRDHPAAAKRRQVWKGLAISAKAWLAFFILLYKNTAIGF